MELTPLEAVGVMQWGEARRMKEGLGKIPEKDIESGNIGSYLAPEDYKPLQNVSNHFLYSFLEILLLGVRRYSLIIVWAYAENCLPSNHFL